MNDTIYQAAALIVPLIFAIVFHEVAHGWVARALGDPTASQLNRLSLNPLRHVDPVGTILLPGALKLLGLPVFGWAKPVPVDFRRLNNPRRDMILVAAAGPGMNLLMALLSSVLLGLLALAVPAPAVHTVPHFVGLSLLLFIQINIFLALFNLIPIPPFDGSHIMEGLLPERAAAAYGQLRKVGFLLVIVLIVVLPQVIPGFNPVGQLIGAPVNWLTQRYLDIAGAIAGG
ncbi:site-2 protease family protein [Novosphingobium aquiterrae]|uniref:Site-2 protease family protein n=1 Tax=Novosphingobium aquiterrae TaxID=624388 RepID=A0ABV6PFH0_9SPHN